MGDELEIMSEMAKLPVKPRDDISKGAYCVYCQQLTGESHRLDCVIVGKRIKVRLTVEFETVQPFYKTSEEIDFGYNEGSWCMSNIIDELDEKFNQDHAPCLDDVVSKIEYLETLDDEQVYFGE